MSIHTIPPSLYTRLQIINPPEKENKHVQFTDLNPVKTFRRISPPVEVSSKPEAQILREEIALLRRRLARLESNQDRSTETMRLSPITSPRPSPAPSEVSAPPTPRTVHSVVESSPFQPVFSELPPPRNVQRALATLPAPRVQPPPPPRLPEPPAARPQPSRMRSFFRKLAVVGCLACSVGVVAGLVSIAGSGPIGLGIAGAFVVGALVLGQIASKLN